MLPIFLLLNRMSSRRRTASRVSGSVLLERSGPILDRCRTCLSTKDLVPLFHNEESEEKRTEDLRLVTGLEIKMNDGLSQKICNNCVDVMRVALQFRRTSRKSEKALRNMLHGKPKKKTAKDSKIKTSLKIEDNVEIEYDNGQDDFQNDSEFQYNVDIKPLNIGKKLKRLPKYRRTRDTIPTASSYKCNDCNKEFKMKATYKAHIRFHTNYCVCEACGKRCRNNNQLQEHKRAKHGLTKIHKCAYCEYSSATKEALTIHERRHTGERPYVCDHCGATFYRRATLVQHIAIHLPEKNFQCDMCPKRLKSRKFLQIHKHNAHTGKRYGYLCPVCNHRFEKPNKVRAHTRRVHGVPDEQQGPICHLCSARAKSHKLLQVHISNRHREKRYRYVCPVCRETFVRAYNVRKHLVRLHSVARHDQGVIEKFRINKAEKDSEDRPAPEVQGVPVAQYTLPCV